MAGMQSSRRKRRSPSEEVSLQDYDSSTSEPQQNPGKQQVRHRASVACASCRERRIRCVVPDGQSKCSQCKRTGTKCIIKNDDERRRPISKAYMSSLSNRIALLEGMLQDRGVVPPPAVHPPKTRREAQGKQDGDLHHQTNNDEHVSASLALPLLEREPPTPPASVDENADMKGLKREENDLSWSHSSRLSLIEPALLQDFEPKRDVDVCRLLCPSARLSLDQSAGRLRYFGNTANIHVYAESSCPTGSREPIEHICRSERILRALGPSTHDYLMSCFWDHSNAVHQIVDQATFEADRVSQDPKFYSLFLQMAMLAAGYRFADRTREDVKKLALGTWESTLHREAKTMLGVELERPGEVPSVQALLILADLECGVGRDTQGWLYAGIANRLAFDIGLHINDGIDMSDTERRVRRQAMLGCLMLDRQLSVFLGRPTSIKNQDIGFSFGPTDFTPRSMASSMLPMSEFDVKHSLLKDAAIHQQLLELLGIISNITDRHSAYSPHTDGSRADGSEGNSYLRTVALDRQLRGWYRRLPVYLTWTPLNVKSAPLRFFLLHQQFHVCMILLHRPWANYGPELSDGTNADCSYNLASSISRHSEASPFGEAPTAGTNTFCPQQQASDGNKVALARSICTQHAIRVSRIFWQHRQRFDGQKMDLVAAQHAGTAAVALMGALAHRSNELDHQSNLRYLQVLSSAIYDMSQTYHPAARMYHLLKSMLIDIRREMVSSRASEVDIMLQQFQTSTGGMALFPQPWGAGATNMYPILPITQEASGEVHEQAAKKRRLLERHSSELEVPYQPLAGSEFTHPSPPTSTQSQRTSSAEKAGDLAPELATLEDDAFDFNFDFLNESIVDFEGMQGVNDARAAKGASISPTMNVFPLIKVETEAEDMAGSAPELVEPQALAREDDDVVEMTIEEWLAEPKGTWVAPAPRQSPAISTGRVGSNDNVMGCMSGADEARVVHWSMNNLVHSVVAKAVGGAVKNREVSPERNLCQLDFLSF